MPATQTSTRDALLAATGELLERVGYASFSYRDLSEMIGIRTASIHYHFPTKEDLGVAWAQWYSLSLEKPEQELCAQYPDVRLRLLAMAEIISEHNGKGCRSCPMSMLQAEFAVLPAKLQAAVRGMVDCRLGTIARWLEEGRSAGQLRFPGSASDQALLVWAVLQYGSQLHRSHATLPLPILVRQLVATISTSS